MENHRNLCILLEKQSRELWTIYELALSRRDNDPYKILITLLKSRKIQSEIAEEKQQRADSNRCIYFANVYTIEYKPCWVIMRARAMACDPRAINIPGTSAAGKETGSWR